MSTATPRATKDAPPSYYRTVYDETWRAKEYLQPCIDCAEERPNLLGHLPNHGPNTDGSFAIWLAKGYGTIVSKKLIDSIPASSRPRIAKLDAKIDIEMIEGESLSSNASVMFPIVLENSATNEKFQIILYALVVPSLFIPVFIGKESFQESVTKCEAKYTSEKLMFTFGFGSEEITVKGIPRRREWMTTFRTVYDETHKDRSYTDPSIASMADRPNLTGYLPHHNPDTDGAFSICLAGGNGTFITKALLESIPAADRPQIDATTAGTKISLSFRGGTLESLGSVLFPVVFTTSTNQKVQLILYALVIPEFQIPMFIGRNSLAASLKGFSELWKGGPTYTLDFGNEKIDVVGF